MRCMQKKWGIQCVILPFFLHTSRIAQIVFIYIDIYLAKIILQVKCGGIWKFLHRKREIYNYLFIYLSTIYLFIYIYRNIFLFYISIQGYISLYSSFHGNIIYFLGRRWETAESQTLPNYLNFSVFHQKKFFFYQIQIIFWKQTGYSLIVFDVIFSI